MSDTDMIKKTFANNLKFYMDEYELNQNDISKIAEVSKQSVSYWLNEKLLPRMGAIEKLAEHFHILKSDLLEDKNEVKPSLKTRTDLSLDFNSIIGIRMEIEKENLIKEGILDEFCQDPNRYYDWHEYIKNKVKLYVDTLDDLINFLNDLKYPFDTDYTYHTSLAKELVSDVGFISSMADDLISNLDDLFEERMNGRDQTIPRQNDNADKKKDYLIKMYPNYDFSDKCDEEINTLYKFLREQEKQKNKDFKSAIHKNRTN